MADVDICNDLSIMLKGLRPAIAYTAVYRRYLANYLWKQRAETKPLINLPVGTVYSVASSFVPEPYRRIISKDRANRQVVVEDILSDGTIVNITTTNSRHVRVIPNNEFTIKLKLNEEIDQMLK